MKLTKVICTIGPSSWDPKVMKDMIDSGMNCARVNGAFADPVELDKVTKLVRDVSNQVSLMMDVKGPEVRMNKFDAPIAIKAGDEIVVGNTEEDHIHPGNYKDLYKNLTVGQRIVIGDGDVELVIKEIVGDKMNCVVSFGELLKPGKAMNLPGATFASSALTEKDIINLKHSITLGWDFVSASFIQNAAAAREVKKYLAGSNMQLIAKIEDQAGVDNIDEILQEVDGIMVARGGLGVELGLEQVPLVQRLLIKKANELSKIVITATQMLESMTYNPRPTRAEVNDVATAIFLNTDVVMLSGESSAGKYPLETVQFMTKICQTTEATLEYNFDRTVNKNLSTQDKEVAVIAKSVAESCELLDAPVIVVWTNTGRTAQEIRKNNPTKPIIAITGNENTIRHLSLTKGVYPYFFNEKVDNNNICKVSEDIAKKLGLVKTGDSIVLATGILLSKDSKTHSMEIYEVA